MGNGGPSPTVGWAEGSLSDRWVWQVPWLVLASGWPKQTFLRQASVYRRRRRSKDLTRMMTPKGSADFLVLDNFVENMSSEEVSGESVL